MIFFLFLQLFLSYVDHVFIRATCTSLLQRNSYRTDHSCTIPQVRGSEMLQLTSLVGLVVALARKVCYYSKVCIIVCVHIVDPPDFNNFNNESQTVTTTTTCPSCICSAQ